LLDGRKEKIGNFRVEPPGLFRGRGEHPKKGFLKVTSFSDPAFFSLTHSGRTACVLKTSPSTLGRMRLFQYPTCPANGRRLFTTIP
jgi:hypothetical protein